MINVAQVVAAVAGGSLLTLAAAFGFKAYGRPRPARPAQDAQLRADDHDDREWRIEAAAQIAVEGFDLLARQATEGGLPSESAIDDETRPLAETFPLRAEQEARCRTAGRTTADHGAVAVRGKRHLTMLTFTSIGLLAPAGALVREVWRTSRGHVIGGVVGATAVSTATLMPLIIDGAPPAPMPTASSPWRLPPQADRELPEPASVPVPLTPTLPEPVASTPAATATASPSESASPSALPERVVSVTAPAADGEPPAHERTPTSPAPPGDADQDHGRATPSPPAHGSEPSYAPPEPPAAPADRPAEEPAGADRADGSCSFACG